jgi:hypothetical protein
MNTQTQYAPLAGNGDGQSDTTVSPPVDPTWDLYRMAERRRQRQRIERQIRTLMRKLVVEEHIRLGDVHAINATHITCGLYAFTKAALDEYTASKYFEQLELEL